MLSELYNAISAIFKAGTAAVKLTELYNTEAPANAEYPFGVVQLVSSVTSDFASHGYHSENCLWQINLYDNKPTMERLLDAYAALVADFDFATLTVTGYTALSCVREGTLQTRVENVWQVTIMYRIKIRS